MSNTENYDDVDDATIGKLRARADQAALLEREVAVQKAELAVLKAGIPTGTKVGQAFLRDLASAEGVDLNDSTSIRKAAEEWGLWQPEGSPARDVQQFEDQSNLAQARDGLVGGTAPDAAPPPSPDPVDEGWANFKRRVYEEGSRREDAFGEVFDRIVTGAVKGDERCVIKTTPGPTGAIQRTWRERAIPYVPGKS